MIDIEDEYERRAYELLREYFAKRPRKASRFGARVGGAAGGAGRRAGKIIPDAITDTARRAMRASLQGLRTLTIDPALRSVRTERVLTAFTSAGFEVKALDDIRSLALKTIDSVKPGLGFKYAAVAAVEGAAAGVAITGGELVATFGSVASAGAASAPGAGTIVGAMAVDAATVLAASARVVAHTGAYYGYDTRLPDEQVFALAIINWSTAGDEAAKTIAFQQLSKITQQLARGAAWAQLSEHVIVQVVREVYVRLGLQLTKKQLGKTIPVAGIVIGAGLNAGTLHRIARDAEAAYRFRHLGEKYDVIFDTTPFPAGPVDDSDAIDIDSIIRQVQQEDLLLDGEELNELNPKRDGPDRGH